ncbi:DUF6624 domain-containing protein [Streptomyces sp. NPDC059835]|uniref:DUF6624 domain-containing protein n=1 Tax=Streptomyces sp. NPDC059835 TaxID=3346967 RepID=UPI0036610607
MTPTAPNSATKPDPSCLNEVLQQKLLQMATAETSARRHAIALSAAGNRRAALHMLQREHASELKDIVAQYGWPTVSMVGEECSAYCLQLLLVCENLTFQTRCRDLIQAAVAEQACPPAQYAFIADKVAVAWNLPQKFGTQINPVTLRPYPIESRLGVDERRKNVGLAPLAEVLESFRALLRDGLTTEPGTGGRRATRG